MWDVRKVKNMWNVKDMLILGMQGHLICEGLWLAAVQDKKKDKKHGKNGV